MKTLPPSAEATPRLRRWLAALAVALAIVAAYANSLQAPFVFDDLAATIGNPTLAHFSSAWFPPPATTVSGRPVANLSLAVDWAISGPAVRSYHVTNVLIHIGSALLLLGIVRRTLNAPGQRERFGGVSL